MGNFLKKYKYGILTPGEKNSGFIYLFILFLLYLFAGIKYFSPEGIASDTKTALLPPQPTLVAGDIEGVGSDLDYGLWNMVDKVVTIS